MEQNKKDVAPNEKRRGRFRFGTRKYSVSVTITILAAVMLISGASILVAGGAQSDPLVTVSYLRDRFTPQVVQELRGDITRAEQDLQQRFNVEIAALEARIAQTPSGGGAVETAPADTFRVITLSRGQTLRASVGTEMMLRIGTATAFGPTAPALVDYTGGHTLAAGGQLLTNHMYLVTIENNGVTATADLVRLLVRGEFTIS